MNPVPYKTLKILKSCVQQHLLCPELKSTTGERNSSLYHVIYLLSCCPKEHKKVWTSRNFCKQSIKKAKLFPAAMKHYPREWGFNSKTRPILVSCAASSTLLLNNYRPNWAPWFKKSQTCYYNESVISEMENRRLLKKNTKKKQNGNHKVKRKQQWDTEDSLFCLWLHATKHQYYPITRLACCQLCR